MRMSSERFRHLLSLLKPKICKQDTALCRAIPPAERLALTLRFLATGDAQQSLGFSFQIGTSTVSKIVKETCDVIYKCFKDEYMAENSDQFEEL